MRRRQAVASWWCCFLAVSAALVYTMQLCSVEAQDNHEPALWLEPGQQLEYTYDVTAHSDCAQSEHDGAMWGHWPHTSVVPTRDELRADSYSSSIGGATAQSSSSSSSRQPWEPPVPRTVDGTECRSQQGMACDIVITTLQAWQDPTNGAPGSQWEAAASACPQQGQDCWLMQLDVRSCTFRHAEGGRPTEFDTAMLAAVIAASGVQPAELRDWFVTRGNHYGEFSFDGFDEAVEHAEYEISKLLELKGKPIDILLGFSQGADLAILLAARHAKGKTSKLLPNMKGLVLLETDHPFLNCGVLPAGSKPGDRSNARAAERSRVRSLSRPWQDGPIR